jgi:adenosylhomocysteine nucleosidase
MSANDSENTPLCLVFPMGVEMGPFLPRVEIVRRWKRGKATYREAYFEGATVLIVRCGIGPKRGADAIRNLDTVPGAILSVGSAGALAPDLRVNDLIVSDRTLSGEDSESGLRARGALVEEISRACLTLGLPFKVGPIATVSRPVWSRQARLRLHEATGALAVDMESHAIGTEAQRLGVPFAALRVVSDDASSPPLPDRRPHTLPWRTPWRLPGPARTMLHWALFVRGFRRCLRTLPPVLVKLLRDRKRSSMEVRQWVFERSDDDTN